MAFRISYAAARRIADHAQSRYPQEACGLIAGHDNLISEVYPVTNQAGNPACSFLLDAQEQLRALKAIDETGKAWIGAYHSHPETAPIPSEADVIETRDFGLVQLIISLRGQKPTFKLWRIHEQGVVPVDLAFEDESSLEVFDPALNQLQKTAILISGAIALLLVLAIAFSLLPPAPELSPLP